MRKNKIRFVYMVALGVLISFMLDLMKVGSDHVHNPFFDFLICILITILVWEGNLRIDMYMNQKYSWVKEPRKRVLIHLLVSIPFSGIAIHLSMMAFDYFVCPLPDDTRSGFMVTALIIGLLVSVIVLSIEINTQFFGNWKSSLAEAERYKNESLQAQLQNLKNQINPHFLFNNLSVLSSLVYKDQDKAVGFINQLSKVYRYLLDNRNCELVTLAHELEFIHSYTFLLQIRFDKNILFNFKVDDAKMNLMLPPLSLQILIENAIKHNEISSEQPLTITIATIDDQLVVSNNLQLRINSEPSSKTGLQNIKDRYSYFTDKQISILEDENSFTVKIPLLKTE